MSSEKCFVYSYICLPQNQCSQNS